MTPYNIIIIAVLIIVIMIIIVYCAITSQQRSLAIVKVTSQVNGNTQFAGSCHPKTISAIKMKVGTIDYVEQGNPQPIFRNNWITGGFSPYG